MSEEKVFSVLLDPAWSWGTIAIDGVSFPIIALNHPVHGKITAVVPKKVVHELIAGLTALVMTKQ